MIINDQTDVRSLRNPVVGGYRRRCSLELPPEADRRHIYADAGVKPWEEAGIPEIPESEWDDRIAELEESRSTIKDLLEDMEVNVLNQKSTNYCWIFAVAHAAMTTRFITSNQEVRYSGASAGAPITGFKNVGGWSSNGLKWVMQNGINEIKDWPETAIDRRYFTDENKTEAKRHRVTQAYFMETRDRTQRWRQCVSTILGPGYPCPVGYSWWSHAINGVHVTRGKHNLWIANSWGDWGQNGYGELADSKKFPDDCCAIVDMDPI